MITFFIWISSGYFSTERECFRVLNSFKIAQVICRMSGIRLLKPFVPPAGCNTPRQTKITREHLHQNASFTHMWRLQDLLIHPLLMWNESVLHRQAHRWFIFYQIGVGVNRPLTGAVSPWCFPTERTCYWRAVPWCTLVLTAGLLSGLPTHCSLVPPPLSSEHSHSHIHCPGMNCCNMVAKQIMCGVQSFCAAKFMPTTVFILLSHIISACHFAGGVDRPDCLHNYTHKPFFNSLQFCHPACRDMRLLSLPAPSLFSRPDAQKPEWIFFITA